MPYDANAGSPGRGWCFVEQTVAEADAGSMTWLLSALGMPTYGAEIYGYGTVIGTGNTVAAWLPKGEAA